MDNERTYTAFAGDRLIASGGLQATILQTQECLVGDPNASVLIFEDQTGAQIDFDFRGTPDEVLARLCSHPLFAEATKTKAGPGRPKLGVVCREVSLLPRHWEWLEQQSGGVSVALRKLIEEARKSGKHVERQARDAAYKFMSVMAGNLPNFEEASRALFAGDQPRVAALIVGWPADVQAHLLRLLQEPTRQESADARL